MAESISSYNFLYHQLTLLYFAVKYVIYKSKVLIFSHITLITVSIICLIFLQSFSSFKNQGINLTLMEEVVLTQWNHEPCHVGPPKMDRSWWKILTKHGPLEKGMPNRFSILALRTPWTVWKGKKKTNITLKDELPRLVGARYAIGEEWRDNSRQNEEMEPKRKQHPVVVMWCDWWWK